MVGLDMREEQPGNAREGTVANAKKPTPEDKENKERRMKKEKEPKST